MEAMYSLVDINFNIMTNTDYDHFMAINIGDMVTIGERNFKVLYKDHDFDKNWFCVVLEDE